VKHVALALACSALCGCATLFPPPPTLAIAHSAPDFVSYELRRIGLLPFHGHDLDRARADELQSALRLELTQHTPYEIVLLSAADMAEIDPAEPHERGAYSTHTVLAAARRFRLDGLLVGTVTHIETYPPLAIGLRAELVASETGLVVWSATLDFDSADARVRDSIEAYQVRRLDESGESGDLALVLLSPSHMLRFAARELGRSFVLPEAR
jgi:hypothetical protein